MTDKKTNNEINDEELYDHELEEIINQQNRENKRSRFRIIRSKRQKKIALITLIALALIGVLYYVNKSKLQKKDEVQSAAVIDENSYNGSNIMRVDLNQLKKINLDLRTADLRIQRSNTNPYIEYTHLYKGEEDVYTLDVAYENGELSLKSKITGKELNMKNKVPIVRIFLPMDKSLDQITAKVDAGDVKITDLEVRNLDLKLRSGHISFANSFFGGSVSNEAGDIILEKSELLKTKLQTNAGDIIINDGKLGSRSDFSTQSGDIIISSSESLDNFNVRASLEVGNFILGNISYRNIKDGFEKNNNADKDIGLTTKVGDIVFNKGEGAILEQEEYITNQPKDKSEENTDDENNQEYEPSFEEKLGESNIPEDEIDKEDTNSETKNN